MTHMHLNFVVHFLIYLHLEFLRFIRSSLPVLIIAFPLILKKLEQKDWFFFLIYSVESVVKIKIFLQFLEAYRFSSVKDKFKKGKLQWKKKSIWNLYLSFPEKSHFCGVTQTTFASLKKRQIPKLDLFFFYNKFLQIC